MAVGGGEGTGRKEDGGQVHVSLSLLLGEREEMGFCVCVCFALTHLPTFPLIS